MWLPQSFEYGPVQIQVGPIFALLELQSQDLRDFYQIQLLSEPVNSYCMDYINVDNFSSPVSNIMNKFT